MKVRFARNYYQVVLAIIVIVVFIASKSVLAAPIKSELSISVHSSTDRSLNTVSFDSDANIQGGTINSLSVNFNSISESLDSLAQISGSAQADWDDELSGVIVTDWNVILKNVFSGPSFDFFHSSFEYPESFWLYEFESPAGTFTMEYEFSATTKQAFELVINGDSSGIVGVYDSAGVLSMPLLAGVNTVELNFYRSGIIDTIGGRTSTFSSYNTFNWDIDADSVPVPVPSTILLLGVGLASLAGTTIRKKKNLNRD